MSIFPGGRPPPNSRQSHDEHTVRLPAEGPTITAEHRRAGKLLAKCWSALSAAEVRAIGDIVAGQVAGAEMMGLLERSGRQRPATRKAGRPGRRSRRAA